MPETDGIRRGGKKKRIERITSGFRAWKRGTTDTIPQEVADYMLIRDLYHCPPSVLDEQNPFLIELHLSLLGIDRELSGNSGNSPQDRIAKLRQKNVK